MDKMLVSKSFESQHTHRSTGMSTSTKSINTHRKSTFGGADADQNENLIPSLPECNDVSAVQQSQKLY